MLQDLTDLRSIFDLQIFFFLLVQRRLRLQPRLKVGEQLHRRPRSQQPLPDERVTERRGSSLHSLNSTAFKINLIEVVGD